MTRQGRWLLCLLILFAAALRVFAVRISAPVDDAYITFRYARNLADGLGFVYNAGERVLGTTTTLFTLLLVPFAKLHIPLEIAAAGLAVAASLGSLLVLFSLVRSAISLRYPSPPRVAEDAGLLAAAFYGLFYAAIGACGYGMETQVFELLALGALHTAGRNRPRAAAGLLALAAMTRPEGLLLAAFLGLIALIRWLRDRHRFPWGPGLLFIALLLPWLLFATVYFGSPVPNSVLAKASQQAISIGMWARFFILRNPVIALTWVGGAIGAFWSVRNRSGILQLLALWAAAYTLFFLIARPPFLGLWYFPPLASPLLGLAAAGVVGIARVVTPRRTGLALLAASFVWMALLVILAPRALATLRRSRSVAEVVYRPMGRWLRDNAKPQDLVEASDIGYIGYLSNRRIWDASALVTPAVWRARGAARTAQTRGMSAGRTEASERPRPDLLVLPFAGSNYTRAVTDGLFETYEPVVRFQLEGRTELRPAADPGPEYERRRVWMPDFLVCRRIGSL